VRRLPGPAVLRLSEGNRTPEALFELFRDWQRTQTQSSVRTLRGLRQQMDVRSCRDAGTTRREAHMRREDPDSMQKQMVVDPAREDRRFHGNRPRLR